MRPVAHPLPERDLARVAECAREDLLTLRGESLFVTGGTGFIGSWLLESLCHASRSLDLRLRICVLTRDAAGFAARLPRLFAEPSVRIVQGDVRNLVFEGAEHGIVIHAATDASAQLNVENPLLMADTIVGGTRRTLEFSRAARARRVLMLSSGGVYGKYMPGVTHAREDYPGGPDPLDLWYTYSESKRMAELLCAIYARQFKLEIPIARIFALVGPRLPLDAHYAAGNFIRDALSGGSIRVAGDGTAVRSYLYAADLVVWLLGVLVRGRSGRAYNVGSDRAVSVRELAEMVSKLSPGAPPVEVAGRADASNPVNHYVPDVNRARTELGLEVNTSLEEALARTMSWYDQKGA